MKKADRPLAERLLELLLASRKADISGELLSQRLGVTRGAVWKEIDRLRQQGFVVESATKRGYRLVSTPNLLTEPLISASIIDVSRNRLICLEKVDSTNLYANRLVLEGGEDGTVVIADCQTDGAGRMGRSFSSPSGQGIYMSMILQPRCEVMQLGMLTSYGGLAVCHAMEGLCGVKPQIKWPNDIILDNRKVCGILTRIASDAETNTVTHAIVGIGINVLQQQFDEDLGDKAISLKQATGLDFSRAELAAAVINDLNLMLWQENWLTDPPKDAVSQLRKRSCTIGRQVLVVSPTASRQGKAVDIDKNGELLVQFGDSVEAVSSGEVSVRGLLGYAE